MQKDFFKKTNEISRIVKLRTQKRWLANWKAGQNFFKTEAQRLKLKNKEKRVRDV